MTEADFERWMDGAYCSMLSDFVVAVTLAESDLAQDVANRWIRSGDDASAAAGWACYEWLLGWRPDSYFQPDTIRALLELAADTIHASVAPGEAGDEQLHGRDRRVLQATCTKRRSRPPRRSAWWRLPRTARPRPFKSAADQIRAAAEKGRIGFKRRAVRC